LNIITSLCILFVAAVSSAEASTYAVARSAVPVLNSAGFSVVFGGHNGRNLKTDSCGQVREMEFIALPGTRFLVTARLQGKMKNICQVETSEYPAPPGTTLFTDCRFLDFKEQEPPPRKKHLPEKGEIVSRMKSASGVPYVWGGNLRQGVGELLPLYYQGKLQAAEQKRLTLAGLDCSGLLYEATNGWTPRNTSALVRYGDSVPVARKGAAEIVEMLEPLDLIVWNGHVLIVLDRETVIESRLECGRAGNGGVIISPLKQRLAAIMKTRQPADQWQAGGKKHDVFVVRRWFPI
jgi:hypothetical protein